MRHRCPNTRATIALRCTVPTTLSASANKYLIGVVVFCFALKSANDSRSLTPTADDWQTYATTPDRRFTFQNQLAQLHHIATFGVRQTAATAVWRAASSPREPVQRRCWYASLAHLCARAVVRRCCCCCRRRRRRVLDFSVVASDLGYGHARYYHYEVCVYWALDQNLVVFRIDPLHLRYCRRRPARSSTPTPTRVVQYRTFPSSHYHHHHHHHHHLLLFRIGWC
jgi:hypothetical protein